MAGPVDARRAVGENPFYVLGLRPACGRVEVEREGAKLLGMLELGLRAAAVYMSPLGPQPRSAEAVRAAMAELRSPERRLLHEFWARLPPRLEPPKAPEPQRSAYDLEPFADAFRAHGWRRP